MNRISTFVFSLLLVCVFSSFAQDQKTDSKQDEKKYLKVLAKADKSYHLYAYKEAIRIYEAMLPLKFQSEYITKQLATCYRLINDMRNAEKYYAMIMQLYPYTADDVYYYSTALRVNEKDVEADRWMTQYREINKNDSRANRFLNAKDKLHQLSIKGFDYRVKLSKLSTQYADFCAAYNGNSKIIFVSGRPTNSMIQYEFAWNETPYLDMYEVKKNNDDSLSAPVMLAGDINSKFHDGPCVITPDGKTMYFTRNNYINQKKGQSTDGVVKLKLFQAILSEGRWTNLKEFPYNSNEYSVGHPAISNDGKRLYFVSDKPGSIGGTDIWYCDKDSVGNWTIPNNIGPIVNSEGNEMFPFIAKNNDLFFASSGHFGLGGLDIFHARAKGKEYSKVENLGYVINSTKDDFGLVLDTTMMRGYLSSNREDGKGDDDIYELILLSSLDERFYVRGIVADRVSKEPMVNAKITLQGEEKPMEVVTDADGAYEFEVATKKKYSIDATADKYFPYNASIITDSLNEDNTVLKHDISLVKDVGYVLQAFIQDKKAKTPIKNCKLTFTSAKKDTLIAVTDSSGMMSKQLENAKPGDKIAFEIRIDAPGYLAKEVKFTKVLDKPGIINLNEFLQIDLEKLLIGADLAKMIDIKPIYFDLNKYNIRKDAAIELDKIVKVMKEYPKMVVELGSHTDCRSSYEYNMKLSDNRAKASAAYIVSKGVETERIYGKGYGESKLVNDCACELPKKSTCTEEQHQQNRRTEFIIIKVE